MTELELYRFIENNNIEYHYSMDIDDVVIFVKIYNLQEFVDLIGSSILDDEGLEIVLKEGYVAIWMGCICEDYDIKLIDVFTNKDN